MEFRLPELGEGVYEAEWIAWRVAPGDAVKRGQVLAEVMTDKANMDLPAPFAGRVTKLLVEAGQMVKIGAAVLDYEPIGAAQPTGATNDAPAPAAAQPSATPASAPAPAAVVAAHSDRCGNGDVRVAAAPSVRRMARKLGVDLAHLAGTGPGGRVLIEDLAGQVRGAAPAAEKPREPQFDYGRPGARIPMRGLRRKIAEQMVRSYTSIPHYSYMDECDVTELVRLRETLKPRLAEAGLRLTFLPFLVKAVVAALREVPIVNSSLEGDEVALHDRYDIGVAVATPGGLIVPVVRGADRLDLAGVARELQRLSNDAKSGHAKLDDLRGATFTITSIGSIGGLISTPIINPPEVGILGVGRMLRRPVYDEQGQLRPADLMYLSFSFDHRVLDGAIGVAFGNAVLRRLQEPATLLLPEKLA